MSDTELDAMIAKLSEWNPQEHPGIRAGKLLEILKELKSFRLAQEMKRQRDAAWENENSGGYVTR